MLTQREKESLVEKFKIHASDTGSIEVQAAILTEEIRQLLLHLKEHAKDVHSKRGLLKMVAKRRTLISYLKREDEKRHAILIKKLGLKH